MSHLRGDSKAEISVQGFINKTADKTGDGEEGVNTVQTIGRQSPARDDSWPESSNDRAQRDQRIAVMARQEHKA